MSKKKVIFKRVLFLTDNNMVTLINANSTQRFNELSGFKESLHNNARGSANEQKLITTVLEKNTHGFNHLFNDFKVCTKPSCEAANELELRK